MAKGISYSIVERKKVRRPGVHAKTKKSSLKSNKYYKKKYSGKEKKKYKIKNF